MLISTSILSIKDNLNEKIEKLNKSNTDYIHLDIMDNIFVPNYSDFSNITNMTKLLDVHLMVEDVYKYIDIYSKLNPIYITFHYEINENKNNVINYIKNKNIKIGLSIKPNTKIKEIIPYLDKIDLVLIMSVEPGYGGQKFIESSFEKIEQLNEIRKNKKYNFVIEVDGGINEKISAKLKNEVDILVAGTFITNEIDFDKQIALLKGNT
ncbi:MAG: ribulose-phosphate 3-epimerase [Bacilli bacterium]|nr:ribulose-phosphate 3-epimerase [Bacilli bacterium]